MTVGIMVALKNCVHLLEVACDTYNGLNHDWNVALGGLVVSVLATGPTFCCGFKPTEDGGFLWVIKIRTTLPSEGK
jgi:hypothetical protein